MSYKLPLNNGKWSVGMDGFADIIQTRNLNLDKTGTIQVAQQPIVLYTSTEDSDFGKVKAIVNDYVITTGNVFKLDPTLGTMTEQTTTSMPDIGIASDAVYYLSQIMVSSSQTSGTDTVDGYNGSSWTARVSGLTNSVPHPLCVFENLKTLCVGNGNIVWQSTSGGYTQDATNTLTLPSQYTVTWMRWRNGVLYIGTRNTTNGSARMFVWNGVGTSTGVGWSVSCDWIYSGADYKSSMVVLTSAGQLLRFNGGGFDELAHLPVYETSYSWSKANASAQSTLGRCDNRGLIAYGDVLYLNIDGQVQGNPDQTYLHSQPSGLWTYDPENGLYHASGYAYSKYSTLTITAVDSSILTVGTHSLETGDEVRAVSVSNITGLTANRDYYVIKVNATQFSLAISPADAKAGRKIILSGTPSGDTLAKNRNNHGAVSTLVPGAVALITNTNQFNQFFGSIILYSGACQDNTNTTVKTLMSPGTGRNVGHFITSRFPTAGVRDTFQKIFMECKDVFLDTESFVIKYRKTDKFGLPTPTPYTGTAIWTDASTFTIDTTKQDFRAVSVGDEIEVIEGSGAGYTAHITAIDSSSSTYSVTIDEVVPGITASDTAIIVADNWKKLGTVDNTTEGMVEDYAEVILGEKGSWCQFKVELRGKYLKLKKLSVLTASDKPVK